MPAISTTTANANKISYQSIYAHQANSKSVKAIKPSKNLQTYLGDLKSSECYLKRAELKIL
jgi:hypothetical protein